MVALAARRWPIRGLSRRQTQFTRIDAHAG
jgi:hypothetical protein